VGRTGWTVHRSHSARRPPAAADNRPTRATNERKAQWADEAPITLAGNLPKQEQYSNVEDHRDALTSDPARLRFAVVAFDTVKVTTMTDTGAQTPVVRIRRIEIADNAADRDEVEKLLARFSEARLGALPLTEADDVVDAEIVDGDNTGVAPQFSGAQLNAGE